MRLLRVELRRLFSRRAVIVMMVLGALACGAIAAGILYETRPPSAADLAGAQRDVDRINQDRFTQRRLDRCVEKTGEVERCERRTLLTVDDYFYRQKLSPAQFKGWLIPMAGVAAAVAFLVGATFVGADFSSGSVGTQLLFEPSRLKVWAAKAGAAVVGAAGFAGLALALTNAAIWLFAKSWDRPFRDGLGGDWSAALGRGVVLAAAAAVGGYALVVLARHTAAALGVLAVYGIAGEAVLRNVWTGSEKWLFSNHVFSWVGGDFKRQLYVECYGGCPPVILDFTKPFAATYMGLVLLAVGLGSVLVFRRRDVP